MSKKTSIIRKVYLYLVTAITIVVLLIAFIGIINLFLKEYVLDVKDWNEMDKYYECEQPDMPMKMAVGVNDNALSEANDGESTDAEIAVPPFDKEACLSRAKATRRMAHVNDLKRDFAQYLAMILVALPLYLYHWGVIKKENE